MRLLSSLMATALTLPAAAAEPPLEGWNVSRLEWTGEVADGTEVAIVNPYGDLQVRAGNPGEVYLLAVIQRHEDDPRRAEVATGRSGGKLRVEVRYREAQKAQDAPAPFPQGWEKRRVDLTVFVPAGARTSARTSAGLLEVRGLVGDVEAASDRGDLRLRTAGGLTAYSRHGEIFAQLRRTDWAGTSEIETVTGDIRVELPRGSPADVRLETRGEITTDYSIDIRRHDDSLLKLGTAKIGEAGGRLVLRSDRGAIRLIESRVPEQQDPTQE